MIAIEITGAIDAAGTLKKFYIADAQFTTKPTDNPANTAFDPSLRDLTTYSSLFAEGRTSGAQSVVPGELSIVNLDGQYDDWLNYSFDGRQVVVRRGNAGDSYPSAFTTILTATCETIEINRSLVSLKLKDKLFRLDSIVNKNSYGGTNVLPNGVDGTAANIKGKFKPRLYGTVMSIDPVLVNTSKLTYQISDLPLASIEIVRDNGVTLIKGADYATSAAMNAAGLMMGGYVTCLAEGMFRLTSAPAGTITASATGLLKTVGQIAKDVVLNAGLSEAEISSADIAALEISNPAVVSMWVNGETAIQVLDELCATIGAGYSFDPLGVFRIGVLTVPDASSLVLLRLDTIFSDYERQASKDTGIPASEVILNYFKRYNTSYTIAGSVAADERLNLSAPYRTAKASNPAIKTQFLQASTIQADTLFTIEADALTEANRRLTLYSTRRDVFTVGIPIDLLPGSDFKLLSIVRLTLSRFGLSNGKRFRLLAVQLQLSANKAYLTLWG